MAKSALPLLLALSLGLTLAPAATSEAKPPRASADESGHSTRKERKERKDREHTESGGSRRERKERAARESKERGEKPSRGTPAKQRAERLGLGTNKAAGQLLRGHPEDSWVRAAGGGAKLPGTLKFPVSKGWFVRGFGSGEGGYHQAMDIGGEVGWNVRAAAKGLVAYADDGINGYGNMVMIVHPGGWVTTYAHNTKNLVVPGQKVDAGTVIASLGSTGRSKGPHVHFELLYDGDNCDPAPLFRPYVPHRNGKHVSVARATWSSSSKRPRAVACHPRKHHPGRSREQPEEAGDVEPEDES